MATGEEVALGEEIVAKGGVAKEGGKETREEAGKALEEVGGGCGYALMTRVIRSKSMEG